NLEVTRVSLFSEGVDRAVRWSQAASGVISLFLAGPVSGEQRLVLHGRLPAAVGQPMQTPVLRVQGGQQAEGLLHLLRKPGILVELHEENGMTPVAAPAGEVAGGAAGGGAAGEATEPDWLPIGSYRMPLGSDATASVLAVVNEPEVTGKEIVRLSVHEGAWHARWECRFDIDKGLLEEVGIAAPANWGNQFQASRGAIVHALPIQGTRRELCVRPEQPAKQRWWAWVSGRLQLGAGERVRVPDITVKDIRGIARFIILPRRVDGLAMDWHVQGLQPVSLAQVAPELAPEQSSLAAFRVVKRPFSAELSELTASWGEGRVYLADYAVEWRASGAVGGVARFLVEPGAGQQCEVHFPEGTRPLMLEVDGRQSPLTGLSAADTLRVTLGPPGIPQRVEIVFEASATQPSRRKLELAAPSIAGTPVEQTLWTVAVPWGRLMGASNPEEESTGWQLALVRLESLGKIAELASSSSANGATESSGWRRHWLRLWAKSRDAADREINRISEADSRREASDRLAALVKQQSEAIKSLTGEHGLEELLPGNEPEDEAFDAWQATLSHNRSLVHCRMDGRMGAISVDLTPAPTRPWVGGVMAGAAWIVLLGTVAFALHRGLLVEWYRRWPQTVGVLVGLGWWLWLSPSILGLVLVIACVATSVRTGWRSVSRPAPDGSVISIVRR
ncbi:MAG: hypothetical protein U1E05_21510, partial [Patescibacteria group bacterium]|nr:hypothetical protein [Patescibacteria group bacterium]